MEATRIIAIRHGETTWNADGRVQGHTDIGLSDTGRAQAQRLAQALAGRDRLDAIYSSDLARARDTDPKDKSGSVPRRILSSTDRLSASVKC